MAVHATEALADAIEPTAVMDLCWPPNPGECEHREQNQNENNLIVIQIGLINTFDPFCAQIQGQLSADVSNGLIAIWTVGPANYSPNDYYGDRHNAPGITHRTALAFSSSEILQSTLIHEAAHAFGVTTDGEATMWENTCRGGL
jgi:hypothetical protein